jgi:hybrid cluster-associated redox disulfide protein
MATITSVTSDSIIGDVIRDVPGAVDIIRKYFGDGCFTCPGINVEQLSFGAMMHNVDPDRLVAEINALNANGG